MNTLFLSGISLFISGGGGIQSPWISAQPQLTLLQIRALQWSGNPYGIGYGLEMDGNGAQFVKMLWIGLDLGKVISLKR